MSINPVISITQAWVREFIVGHNICPFAKKEVERNSIHYAVLEGAAHDSVAEDNANVDDIEEVVFRLVELCKKLDKNEGIETALLVLEHGFADFERYLDLLDVANDVLTQQGYEGVYQLASFHPDYCFDGVDEKDASHYSNRSPYPMLHILREDALTAVLARYPNPEAIPERNIAYCQELGEETLKGILQRCQRAANRAVE